MPILVCLAAFQAFGYWDLEPGIRVEDPRWGSDFGRCVAVLGDVDGDLISDLAVVSTLSTGWDVAVLSGASGYEIRKLPVYYDNSNYPTQSCLAPAGDITGDHVPDLFVQDNNRAMLFSGADGALIWSKYNWLSYSSRIPGIARIRDFDGDGLADAVTSHHTTVRILSGADGSELAWMPWPSQAYGDFGVHLDASGDANGDGRPDVLVGDASGGLAIYDGRNGSLIRLQDHRGYTMGTTGCWWMDLDGDGCDEYVTVVRGTNGYQNDVRVFSGRTGAYRGYLNVNDQTIVHVSRVGDLDHDGRPEVAACGGPIYLFSAPEPDPIWSYQTTALITGCAGPAEFNLLPGSDLVIALPGAIYPWLARDFGVVETWTAFINPILDPGSATVSAAAGGRVDLPLDFPVTEAYRDYRLLVSTGPGYANLFGLAVPLAPSLQLAWTARGYYPPFAYFAKGKLDLQGDAAPFFDFLPGEASTWAGRTVWLAAGSYRLDSYGRPLDPGRASIPQPFTILP